jgi:hypothetical protein
MYIYDNVDQLAVEEIWENYRPLELDKNDGYATLGMDRFIFKR